MPVTWIQYKGKNIIYSDYRGLSGTGKCALLGVEGIKKVLLQAYNWFTGAGARQRVFDSEQTAKDWLVE